MADFLKSVLTESFLSLLPAPARTAWYQINALGDQCDREQVAREIARTLLKTQYRIAQKQVVSQIEVEPQQSLESEDDILSAAVRLTSDE